MKPKQRNIPISGSYPIDDVRFLLNQLRNPPFVSLEEKERRIRQGEHYSQMVHQEAPPSEDYLRLFYQMMTRNKERLAAEVLYLAHAITERRTAPITLVSLARAGTPIGVLVHRVLKRMGVESVHYSISIMRGQAGTCDASFEYILKQQKRPSHGIAFIDGWTAKGAITRQLKSSVAEWNCCQQEQLNDELFVIADVGGTAACAATFDDYAIPSGMLGATVSGLLSRTVINSEIGQNDFHGTHYFEELEPYDLSRWFVDQIDAATQYVDRAAGPEGDRIERFAHTQAFLREIMDEFRVDDINRVKPGIVEGTRVLNRRIPDVLLVKNPAQPDVAHMLHLARQRQAHIVVRRDMPYNALCLIKDVQNDVSK
jgi:hypothetical protein